MIEWQSIHKFGKEMFWTKSIWCQGPKSVDQKYFWLISDPKKIGFKEFSAKKIGIQKRFWGKTFSSAESPIFSLLFNKKVKNPSTEKHVFWVLKGFNRILRAFKGFYVILRDFRDFKGILGMDQKKMYNFGRMSKFGLPCLVKYGQK